MRSRTSIPIVTVIVIATAFLLVVWFGLLTPAAPSGWAQIHTGMSRDEVLLLAGSPQQSGWPEKIAETWEHRGVICNRRLFIYYREEQLGTGYVQAVCEGTWL